jgi:pimeloyl-ACP methyl ester carboxylesterase
MDGTGQLFDPLLSALPSSFSPTVVGYPANSPCDYDALFPLVEAALPAGRDFVVLGESFSGPLALRLAARRPAGLRGVVLCASFARSPLPIFAGWFRWLIWPLWFRFVPRPLLRWALLGRFNTARLGELLETAVAAVDPAVMAARARAIVTVDVSLELQSCPVPVLYLSASEDRVVRPRSLTIIRKLYPDVESVTLPGPHLLLQAAPKAAAEAMQRFAALCESSSSSQLQPHSSSPNSG